MTQPSGLVFAIICGSRLLIARADCPAWETYPYPPGGSGPLVYDAEQHLTIALGPNSHDLFGSYTWGWNGQRWLLLATAGPPLRSFYGMTYDPNRQVTVLFSGRVGNTTLTDTWEWDGVAWTQRANAGPLGRAGCALAYDAVRQEVILFGGELEGVYLYDTWAWNGVAWQQRSLVGPPGRSQPGMCFDSNLGRVIMHGGTSLSPTSRDTWAWDGTSWMVVASGGPATGPTSMFSVPDGAILTANHETWHWNGALWALRASDSASGAGAYDAARDRWVLLGGSFQQGTVVYEFIDNAWTRVSGIVPLPVTAPAVAYDALRDVVYSFGGSNGNGLWYNLFDKFVGDRWQPISGSMPPARSNAALVYDEHRDRLVLFGGYAYGAVRSDLWEWDGGQWLQIAAAGPAARFDHAMVYDAARERVLLFGGANLNQNLGDFWSWDGTTWTQLPVGPGPRSDHAMAFNSRDGRVYLQGGVGSVVLNDLWSWDGAEWSLVSSSGPACYAHGMIYDPLRDELLVCGGDYYHSRDVSAWNGSWHDVPQLAFATYDFGLVYQAQSQQAFAYAGRGNTPTQGVQTLRSASFRITSPHSTAAVRSRSLTLCVESDAASPLTYAWRRDGVPLVETEHLLGVATHCLTINGALEADAGSYDVRLATTGCDPVFSIPAHVILRGVADLNCDGIVNNFDIDPFVLALTNPISYTEMFPDCSRALADINNDSAVNNFDIDSFVQCLLSACP